ncbi:response regulator [Litorimonas sp. RW-G-Af-16]|uniref:response regulator n=1 Tax=Litorimonas sp. RW-G-Af-16 TaxID=3241168 RepID=UPI00390CBA68
MTHRDTSSPHPLNTPNAKSVAEGHEAELLHTLCSALNVGVSVLDEDLRYQLISNEVYRQLGISPDQLQVGDKLSDCHDLMIKNGLITAEFLERQRLSARDLRHKKDTPDFASQNLLTLGDGTTHRHLRKTLPNGLTVSMSTDVSELVEKDEMLESALALGNSGYWTYDFETKKYRLSESFRAYLSEEDKRKVEEAGIITIVHQDDRAKFKKAIASLSSTQSKFQVSCRTVSRKGNERWSRTSGELIRNEDGRPIKIRAFVKDITADVRRSAELERMKDQAIAANQAKSEFLANMSHEIRTPMNGILGMAELLANSPVTSRQREFVDVINNSATALLSIINDILDFSKIEAGAMELDPVPMDLKTLINDLTTMLRSEAQDKGLELIIDYPVSMPRSFIGDIGRLRQTLINLIGNAIKFTDQGHITIKVDVVERNTLGIITVNVIDTGIGVAEEKLANIFDKFTQADGSTTRVYGGTGLGLTISKGIIEMMGGRMQVSSVVGEGSSFGFIVPMPLDFDAMIEVPDFTSLVGKTALIVDDIETNRIVLSEQLAMWGVKTLTSCNSLEAIDIIGRQSHLEQKIDFILLDYQMPGCNGEDLARQIKSLYQGHPPPMIMLSSCDQNINSGALAEIGIRQYIVKPVREKRLLSAVQTAVASAPPRPKQAISPPSEPPISVKSKTPILVAEDFALNRDVVRLMLEDSDYRPVFAHDGAEAVRMFSDGPTEYAAILMDVSMPVMDGYDATRQIRAIERMQGLARLPIIALTGHALSHDRGLCLQAGMNDYLTKPVRQHKLIEKLEQLLDTYVEKALRAS